MKGAEESKKAQGSAVATEIMEEVSKLRQARQEKQYLKTKGVDDQATPLNKKRIEITASNGLVSEGGMFSSSYITYKVQTSGAGIDYDVRRRDSDFYFLKKHLLRCFPHIIIPPCPKDAPKLIADRIKKRERYYTRFLQAIARCEELKTNKFLLSFLAEKD